MGVVKRKGNYQNCGKFERTEEQRDALRESLAKAREVRAAMPRRVKKPVDRSFIRAEVERVKNLNAIRNTVEPNSELAELVAEQAKDERSFMWGSLRTTSLDAPLFTEDTTSLYDIIAVQDHQEWLEDRMDRLAGY